MLSHNQDGVVVKDYFNAEDAKVFAESAEKACALRTFANTFASFAFQNSLSDSTLPFEVRPLTRLDEAGPIVRMAVGLALQNLQLRLAK